jgi:hypothetical protein
VENLRKLSVVDVFLFETPSRFRDIDQDAFATKVPGNSVIICVCGNGTRTVILDPNARMEKVY